MSRENEILMPDERLDETPVELSIRPKRLAEFIGQEKLKDNLSVFLQASKQRGESLDHVLLFGPPGLGKTTLANIVATEMGVPIHTTSGPAIVRPGDLVGILTNLEPGAVLFIDEIHRLTRTVEEILYPAMEDRMVDIMIGQGPAARSIRLDLPAFTIVGATTRQGLLTGPLRDRFGIVSHFAFYDDDALFEIIHRSATILGYEIDEPGARELACRSRGTPRIANRLLRRVRDFVQVQGATTITKAGAEDALSRLEVDPRGLDRVDRMILESMIRKYDGGPVGLETLAASTGEDSGTIEDVYEPYLLQIGMIQRTPRGRMVTALAYQHLGIAQPKPKRQASDPLFEE